MIIYKTGNIFDSNCETLVNPVNVFSVMGKNLALQFKEKYPEMFAYYKNLCHNKQLNVNKVEVYNDTKTNKKIVLFPTKYHWKNPSKIEWIKNGLEDLLDKVSKHNIQSIAMPLLGCGAGGLNKQEVLPLLEEFGNKFEGICEIYIG